MIEVIWQAPDLSSPNKITAMKTLPQHSANKKDSHYFNAIMKRREMDPTYFMKDEVRTTRYPSTVIWDEVYD